MIYFDRFLIDLNGPSAGALDAEIPKSKKKNKK